MPVTDKPLVSVIMASYNMAAHLGPAIRSLQRQTYPHWELNLVDDGSRDNTHEVVSGFDDRRIHYLRQENQGRSAARNRAIAMSAGEYLAPTDADDISHPRRLELEVEYLEDHPEVGVVSGQVVSFSEGDASRQVERYPVDPEEIHRRFSRGVMGICHGGSLIRREVLERLGGYCEDCMLAEDLDLFFRVADKYRFAALPEVVLYYRNDPRSIRFAYWVRLHLYHEYAGYRRRMLRRGATPVCFDRFARRAWPWAWVLSWHTARYAKLMWRQYHGAQRKPLSDTDLAGLAGATVTMEMSPLGDD